MIDFDVLVEALQIAATRASEALAEQQAGLLDKYFLRATDSDDLVPRMVRVGFPNQGPKGPEQHDVSVPLITLVTPSVLQADSLTIEMSLDALTEDSELKVGFSNSDSKLRSRPDPDQTASGPDVRESRVHLSMTFRAGAPSEGLCQIIDGYTRAIKAQIPF